MDITLNGLNKNKDNLTVLNIRTEKNINNEMHAVLTITNAEYEEDRTFRTSLSTFVAVADSLISQIEIERQL